MLSGSNVAVISYCLDFPIFRFFSCNELHMLHPAKLYCFNVML